MCSGDILARLCNIEVRYGKRTVLHDINIDVNTGDFLAVIGPNGAGKSTLLGLFKGVALPVSQGRG